MNSLTSCVKFWRSPVRVCLSQKKNHNLIKCFNFFLDNKAPLPPTGRREGLVSRPKGVPEEARTKLRTDTTTVRSTAKRQRACLRRKDVRLDTKYRRNGRCEENVERRIKGRRPINIHEIFMTTNFDQNVCLVRAHITQKRTQQFIWKNFLDR